MTAAEIKARIAQLEAEIKTLDIKQRCYKLLINSAYGAMISPKNPIGDTDLGNAITKTGVDSIFKVNEIVVQFVKKVIKDGLQAKADAGDADARRDLVFLDSPSKFKKVIIRNATDSVIISLHDCGVKMFDENGVTEEGYKLVNSCGEYLNTHFQEWYKKRLRIDRCLLSFKREKICDVGLWLESVNSESAAKNSSALHVLDNEGVTQPSFEYTGVKLNQSTIPEELKRRGREIVEHMLTYHDMKENDMMVRQFFMDFSNMPINDKAMIARCTNLKKYDNTGMEGYVIKTPANAKAALNYNKLIDTLGLKKYPKIKSGDIMRIVHLHKNRFKFDTIGYLDDWPKEFDEYLKVDNNTLFEKGIFQEIKRFYKSADWPVFNPSDGYAFSLFDFADMFSNNN